MSSELKIVYVISGNELCPLRIEETDGNFTVMAVVDKHKPCLFMQELCDILNIPYSLTVSIHQRDIQWYKMMGVIRRYKAEKVVEYVKENCLYLKFSHEIPTEVVTRLLCYGFQTMTDSSVCYTDVTNILGIVRAKGFLSSRYFLNEKGG